MLAAGAPPRVVVGASRALGARRASARSRIALLAPSASPPRSPSRVRRRHPPRRLARVRRHLPGRPSLVRASSSLSFLSGGASLIAPAQTLEIWTALLASASFGYYANRTRIGGALSGPVCAMLVGAALANANVLPPPGPHYQSAQNLVVSLATPLLLLGADVRVMWRVARRLLQAFLLGSLTVAVAASLSFYGLSSAMHGVGSAPAGDGWKVAAALTAKCVGGGLNYVAVANTLGVSPDVFAAGIAADNVFALAYFPLVSALGGAPLPGGKDGAKRDGREREGEGEGARDGGGGGRGTWLSADEGDESSGWDFHDSPGGGFDSSESPPTNEKENVAPDPEPSPSSSVSPGAYSLANVTVGAVLVALAVACGVASLADRLAPAWLGPLPASALVATAFASLVPREAPGADRRPSGGAIKNRAGEKDERSFSNTLRLGLRRRSRALAAWVDGALVPAGDLLGGALLFVFFAAAGASGGSARNLFSYPALFGFLALTYLGHLGLFLTLGRVRPVFGFTAPELLVASNANVGGAATASALAAGKNWSALVVPAMLAGNLGNAVGTFVGLGVAKVFYHLCW